jgi:hypothetical protein
LPHFIVFACFAIKIQQDPTPIILPHDQELVNVAESQDLEKLVNVETQSREIPLKGLKSPLNYALKLVTFIPKTNISIQKSYCPSMFYIGLELIFAMVGALARATI